MKAYLDILDNCLTHGTMSGNRTGIDTVRIPWGATFEHDMSNGFPLVTTKKMGLKNIATELESGINLVIAIRVHGRNLFSPFSSGNVLF